MWMRWNDIARMFNAMNPLQHSMNRRYSSYGRPGVLPAAWERSRSEPRTNLYDAGDHLEMQIEVPASPGGSQQRNPRQLS